MGQEVPLGMKCFLLALLDILDNGEKCSCETVEKKFSTGIVDYLYSLFKPYFDKNAFDLAFSENIDAYYKNLYGVVDGREYKYSCTQDDGIKLLIGLAIDNIY